MPRPPKINFEVERKPNIRMDQFIRNKTLFDDYIPPDEDVAIQGEPDPNVLRVQHYKGYVLKKYKPYNHWRIYCKEDFSKVPSELSGNYTDTKSIRAAIDAYLEKDTSKNEN